MTGGGAWPTDQTWRRVTPQRQTDGTGTLQHRETARPAAAVDGCRRDRHGKMQNPTYLKCCRLSYIYTPFSGQFSRQYIQFENSTGNSVRHFGGRSGMIRRADCRNWLHFYRIPCRLSIIGRKKVYNRARRAARTTGASSHTHDGPLSAADLWPWHSWTFGAAVWEPFSAALEKKRPLRLVLSEASCPLTAQLSSDDPTQGPDSAAHPAGAHLSVRRPSHTLPLAVTPSHPPARWQEESVGGKTDAAKIVPVRHQQPDAGRTDGQTDGRYARRQTSRPRQSGHERSSGGGPDGQWTTDGQEAFRRLRAGRNGADQLARPVVSCRARPDGH